MRREKYLELKQYIEELKVVSSNMREKSFICLKYIL